MKQLWLRRMAAVTALALVAAACGNGDDVADDPVDEPDTEDTVDDEPDDDADVDDDADADDGDAAGDDDVLNLGYILPESGPLAFLGPPCRWPSTRSTPLVVCSATT
jgi:hypothetical protein